MIGIRKGAWPYDNFAQITLRHSRKQLMNASSHERCSHYNDVCMCFCWFNVLQFCFL